MSIDYIYSERAVAFLDVMGFENKLFEFEDEAITYRDNGPSNNVDTEQEEDDNGGNVYYSKKANEFIETFNSAILKLDKDKFNFYLFSDNICITAKNILQNGERSLIELLLVVSELYFEFVQKGYFLRGGIDYGLFIDRSSIALGVPLANAYKIETSQAIFPRIVLSKNFIKQFEYYPSEQEVEYSSFLAANLIKQSCEISYLNVFNHIFKLDDKEFFFERFSHNISTNLVTNSNCERIYIKYKWLAEEFNEFIDAYTNRLAFFDENFEASEEFLKSVTTFKISHGH